MDNRVAYIFDVDGTLTESRQPMEPEMQPVFFEFCQTKPVYLVTGSDRAKTLEQIGEMMYHMARRVYNCSGNDVWSGDNNIFNNDWKLPEKPWKYLESKLIHSQFGPKTGYHLEERPGMLNFSILGRKATLVQRQQYVEWDNQTNERRKIADEFNKLFGKEFDVVAHVGGETGLDIMPTGCDKSQILKDFDDYDRVVFFGDRTDPGGNDHSLAQAILKQKRGISQPVTGWNDTKDFLEKILNNS